MLLRDDAQAHAAVQARAGIPPCDALLVFAFDLEQVAVRRKRARQIDDVGRIAVLPLGKGPSVEPHGALVHRAADLEIRPAAFRHGDGEALAVESLSGERQVSQARADVRERFAADRPVVRQRHPAPLRAAFPAELPPFVEGERLSGDRQQGGHGQNARQNVFHR